MPVLSWGFTHHWRNAQSDEAVAATLAPVLLELKHAPSTLFAEIVLPLLDKQQKHRNREGGGEQSRRGQLNAPKQCRRREGRGGEGRGGGKGWGLPRQPTALPYRTPPQQPTTARHHNHRRDCYHFDFGLMTTAMRVGPSLPLRPPLSPPPHHFTPHLPPPPPPSSPTWSHRYNNH